MAGKGFNSSNLLVSKGSRLIFPPFLRDKNRFSKKNCKTTSNVAKACINVKKAIARVKNFYNFQWCIPRNFKRSVRWHFYYMFCFDQSRFSFCTFIGIFFAFFWRTKGLRICGRMYLTLVYTLTHGINFCPCSKCLEFIPNVRISCGSSKSQVLAQPHLD